VCVLVVRYLRRCDEIDVVIRVEVR
jgi:hypothetical protein